MLTTAVRSRLDISSSSRSPILMIGWFGVGGPADQLRRELLERLLQVALPQPVGLHRVEIGVHDLEAVLLGSDRVSWVECGSFSSLLARHSSGQVHVSDSR